MLVSSNRTVCLPAYHSAAVPVNVKDLRGSVLVEAETTSWWLINNSLSKQLLRSAECVIACLWYAKGEIVNITISCLPQGFYTSKLMQVSFGWEQYCLNIRITRSSIQLLMEVDLLLMLRPTTPLQTWKL